MAHILVVDDNPDNRKLLTWVLEDSGYSYDQAETAEQALIMLAGGAYDLVLMDISLPGMNGDEATRQLREQPHFATLPIIAVTAHAVKGEVERILDSGVTALVTKPIDEDALLALMSTLLGEA